MIFIFGISISLFLEILLILKKKKSEADIFLIFWFFVIAVHQSLFYINYTGDILNYGFLIGVIIPFPLLHGPFLYIYTSLLIKIPLNKSNRNYWIHFVPFLLVNIYLINFYLLPKSEKLYIFDNEGTGYKLFMIINLTLIIVSGIGYILNNLLIIRKHQKKIKDNFSNIDKINLNWLQYLSYGLLFIWAVVIFKSDIYISLAVTLFVLIMGLRGISQKHIFTNQLTPEKIAEIKKPGTQKSQYLKSGLTDEKRIFIKKNLSKLMDNEKLYLDPELSISILEAKLNIQSNYISQYINEDLGKNFYQYINAYRVNEFKQKISEPKYKHYKIMEIAYECGFNSKSSFNRIFRKTTNLTPSEYWKTIKPSGLKDKWIPKTK